LLAHDDGIRVVKEGKMRPDRLSGLVVHVVLALIFFQCADAADMKGTVTVLKYEKVTVHSYMAPADGLFVTSQILETPNQIIIVDAQYTRPYAMEVLDYVKGLNKPVSRIYVSHSHPDHWNGLGAFAGYPIYTLPEIKAEISVRAGRGQADAAGSNPAADVREISADVLSSGKETIDGVRFEFEKVSAAEGSAHLLIRLPEISTLIAQDLVYNNVHLYAGQNEFDHWISVLSELKSRNSDATILTGHGKPVDRSGYDSMIAYLENLRQFRETAKNGEELKQKLLEKYPAYNGSRLIDISLPRLYPPAK
jgi:glyoxylase-like metal-dependent hydrolase (beta-lactamase superfamily II)